MFKSRLLTQFEAQALDKLVVDRLMEVIEQGNHGQSIRDKLQHILQSRRQTVVSIDKQIEEAKKQLARIARFLDVESPLFDALSDKELADYNRRKKRSKRHTGTAGRKARANTTGRSKPGRVREIARLCSKGLERATH